MSDNGSSGIEQGMDASRFEAESPHKSSTFIRFDEGNPTAVSVAHAISENNGRIPYSQFMDISLFGAHGYYSRGKVKFKEEQLAPGFTEIVEGHYRTAPTRTEHFSTTVGNSVMHVWEAMGRPKEFPVIEMGAGDGTMAKDLLLWAKTHQPEFYQAMRYVIVEYGDLVAVQQKTVGEELKEKITWHQGSAIDLPFPEDSVEGVFLSNELVDQFSVEVVKKIDGQVKQKFVTLEDNTWVELWEDPTEDVQEYIDTFGIVIEDGTEEPINLNATRWQKGIDRILKKGAIITFDYGKNAGSVGGDQATRVYPSSLQSFSEYRNMGNVDITSNVNFGVLEQIMQNDNLQLAYSGSQMEFLERFGIRSAIQAISQEMQATNSLARIEELTHQIADLRALIDNYKPFYTTMAAKNVSVSMPPADTVREDEDFKTGFRLQMGSPNANFTLQGEDLSKAAQIASDGNGFIYLDQTPFTIHDLLPGGELRIEQTTSNGQTQILTTHDQDKVKQVLEASGYTYDLAM